MRMQAAKTRQVVTLGIVLATAAWLAPAASAQTPIKRFHAHFCGHETPYSEDLRIFGWEVASTDDGRIENGSGGIFPSTKELYCPDELMADSAKMNMWLHKQVLGHIAANGGNIPAELL